MTVRELKDRLDDGETLAMLDVREPEEWEVSHLPSVTMIAKGEVPERLDELDPAAEWVVICRGGVRSAEIVEFLRGQGYQAHNLDGGMKAWAAEIQPGLPVA